MREMFMYKTLNLVLAVLFSIMLVSTSQAETSNPLHQFMKGMMAPKVHKSDVQLKSRIADDIYLAEKAIYKAKKQNNKYHFGKVKAHLLDARREIDRALANLK
jgi:hypothetical protein